MQEKVKLLKKILSGNSDTKSGFLNYFINRNVFYNISKSILSPLCNGRFEFLREDIETGAPMALSQFSEKVANKDFNWIFLSTEKMFAKRLEESLLDLPFHWKINKVEAATFRQLQLFMGVQRGDDIKAKVIVPVLGNYFILDYREEEDMRNLINSIRKELYAGIVVQATVDLLVNQSWSIGDDPEKINQVVRQKLKLEMSVEPKGDLATEFRPTNNPHSPPPDLVTFQASEWKICDLNDALDGNFPIEL